MLKLKQDGQRILLEITLTEAGDLGIQNTKTVLYRGPLCRLSFFTTENEMMNLQEPSN